MRKKRTKTKVQQNIEDVAKTTALTLAAAATKAHGAGWPIKLSGVIVSKVGSTIANPAIAARFSNLGATLASAASKVSGATNSASRYVVAKAAPTVSKIVSTLPGSKYLPRIAKIGKIAANVALPAIAAGVVSDNYFITRDLLKTLKGDQMARARLEAEAPILGREDFWKKYLGAVTGRYSRKTQLEPKVRDKIDQTTEKFRKQVNPHEKGN